MIGKAGPHACRGKAWREIFHRGLLFASALSLFGCPSGSQEQKQERTNAVPPPAGPGPGVPGSNERGGEQPERRAPPRDSMGQADATRRADPATRDSTRPDGTSKDKAVDQAPFEGTAGIVTVDKTQKTHILKDVRAGKHPGFDRVVFEFERGVPGYHLEYVDHPVRDCGSGDAIPVAGDGWLEVRMTPADAHTEKGKPTVQHREFAPNLPVVREVQRTCDFEAIVTYVLGTSTPNRYRVLELEKPARLIVDILHEN